MQVAQIYQLCRRPLKKEKGCTFLHNLTYFFIRSPFRIPDTRDELKPETPGLLRSRDKPLINPAEPVPPPAVPCVRDNLLNKLSSTRKLLINIGNLMRRERLYL